MRVLRAERVSTLRGEEREERGERREGRRERREGRDAGGLVSVGTRGLIKASERRKRGGERGKGRTHRKRSVTVLPCDSP